MANGVNVRFIVVTVALGIGCSSDADAPMAPFADDDGEDETGEDETGEHEPGEAGEESGGGDGDGEPPAKPMPDNAYCQPVLEWSEAWDAHAEQVIAQVNAARALGGDCGAMGSFAPAPPLLWHANLTCAARVHSGDMAEHDFFDHKSSDGHEAPWRYEQAGFTGATWAENLGAGYPSPTDAVEGWLASDIHCAHILDPNYVAIGVGYAFAPESTYESYWTLSFGGAAQ